MRPYKSFKFAPAGLDAARDEYWPWGQGQYRSYQQPPGVEKLSGQEKYRIRQGAYRILCEIRNNELIVVVVKTGHRLECCHVQN